MKVIRCYASQENALNVETIIQDYCSYYNETPNIRFRKTYNSRRYSRFYHFKRDVSGCKKMLYVQLTAHKKHLFTNVLFCENCQKGMWYKANQKGYRCGGNIKYGDTFCPNSVVIREKELKHIILEDLQELFETIQDDELIQDLQKRLDQKKVSITNEITKIENKAMRILSRKIILICMQMKLYPEKNW